MPVPLLVPLWLLASDPLPSELAPDEVDAVEVSWTQVQAMREALADEPAPWPGPWAEEREVELRPAPGGLMLRGTWTLAAPQPGFVFESLLGPGIELHSATLGGNPAPVIALPGRTMLVAWVEGPMELKVRAFIPTAELARLELGLLPATRGRLHVAIPGRVPVAVVDESSSEAPAVIDGGVVWSGASVLALELRDPDRAPPAREVLAVAHAGVGLTVGDAEVRGRAHLQWELRHGSLPRVRATVAGLGDDLTVEGRDVAQWARNGDTIEVELNAPVSTRVDLQLRWTQAIGASDETRLPLPRIEPDAWRSESSLQLARDGELEVIPEVDEGMAIPAAALPSWGQGLVEGTPTAAYQRAGAPAEGHLDLLRFVPVPGPPTVVDVATYTVATTEEGRVLMKAHFDLRNDRGAHLTVRPPPGLHIIGARVGKDTALPSRDDDGAWRIPLRRSLETVDGLLSFPVEVIMLGEQEPWARRERRELPLPTLDAPVASSRTTVFLPPGYHSRLEAGERNVVGSFGEGEGLAYGRGVGADDTAMADALFEDAVQGYLDNDFEQAQATLEQLEQLGVRNENMSRLRANIDVIEGKADAKDKADVTLQRRVKEQAKVRATEDFRRQEQLIAEAEKAAEAGDYAEAENQYKAALDLGGKLAKLEQTESVEQDTRNAVVELELKKTVSKKKGNKSKQRKRSKNANRDEGGRFAASVGKISTTTNDRTRTLELEGDDDAALGGLGPTGGEATGSIDQLLDPSAAVAQPAQSAEVVPQPEPEPEPEPEPVVLEEPESDDYAADYEAFNGVAAEEAPRRARFRRSRRARGRNVLETKFKSSRPGRSSRRMGGAKSGGGDTAATVYDFEDDNVDGEILRPEGATLSSRARSRSASMVAPPASIASPDAIAPTDEAPPPPEDAAPPDEARSRPDDALPAPVVTASALSVVVPATGEAVRYELLLLDANQTQTIEIHARRRLRR